MILRTTMHQLMHRNASNDTVVGSIKQSQQTNSNLPVKNHKNDSFFLTILILLVVRRIIHCRTEQNNTLPEAVITVLNSIGVLVVLVIL
jgi:hypothetical protein